MVKDDTLWKGILENVWDDFLRFTFADADNIFDMAKGFVFMDKELDELFPDENSDAPKFVDKLVKVFTKAGTEEWILVHVEVQGYNDINFSRRMFTYFYRILDRYDKPVTAVVIFTDTNKNFHPQQYEYSYLGTRNIFSFNTYKILDQDEKALETNANPFAVVALTVLLALKRKRLTDDDLLKLKLQVFRNLIQRKIAPEKLRGLHAFLKLYVHFATPETNIKFDTETKLLTNNKTTMGIEEFVLNRAEKKGFAKGREEESLKNQTDVSTKLILKTDFSDEQIAEIAGASVTFVVKLRKTLSKS